MNTQKLFPVCKDYIWGGTKLKTVYGKVSDKEVLAESWELSFHNDGASKLSDGKELREVAGKKELGTNTLSFPFFPTLIKFIDAKDNLSVQVHPSDDYALKNENSFGKTEMWYIVDAEEGAGLYLGFNKDVNKSEYEQAVKENKLTDLLNFYKVKKGECYFIPSGTVHAIGKGCLICEIQQNSNLTYRVYDFGRVDKFGNPRELHVEKALKVSNLNKFINTPLKTDKDEGLIGVSKYFTVYDKKIKDKIILNADEKSFKSITLVEGKGSVDGQKASKGDTFFVPAGRGEFYVEGDMEIIINEIRKYYVGIDLGGTFIKGGIVDDTGKIIVSDKIPTESPKGAEKVAENIAKLVKMLLGYLKLSTSDVEGIGIGVPGMIDTEKGNVIFSNNLAWEDFHISKNVEKLTGLKVKIDNDANVAALGEAKFGSGKAYKNSVMITLGTGVGSGIILDGKIYSGNRSAGAEIGHMAIIYNGEQCTCGRKGCLEAYASATALIRDTKKAMLEDKKSKMWEIGDIEKVDGKTAFSYRLVDATAKKVVDNYIGYLACGIVNIGNIFRPDAVILGGGICAEKENLTTPLKETLKKEIFAKEKGPEVKVLIAELGNSAGLLGAAALLM